VCECWCKLILSENAVNAFSVARTIVSKRKEIEKEWDTERKWQPLLAWQITYDAILMDSSKTPFSWSDSWDRHIGRYRKRCEAFTCHEWQVLSWLFGFTHLLLELFQDLLNMVHCHFGDRPHQHILASSLNVRKQKHMGLWR